MTDIGLRTLVLNSNFVPISIFPLQTIPAEDAVTRVFNDTCRVVLEYNRMILTPNLKMKWPSVIARTDIKAVRGGVRLDSESLYYRDHGLCAYCEKKLAIANITLDHVMPRSKGGRYRWENIVSACERCNTAKGDSLPEGRWVPRIKPFRPTYFQLLNVRKNFPITVDHEDWMQFIGSWNAPVKVRHVMA